MVFIDININWKKYKKEKIPSINDILDGIGHASWNFSTSLANGLIRFSDDILPFVPGVDSSLMKKSFNDYQQDLRMIKALKDLISHKKNIWNSKNYSRIFCWKYWL